MYKVIKSKIARVLFPILVIIIASIKSHSYIKDTGIGATYQGSWGPAIVLAVEGRYPFLFKNYVSPLSFSGEDGKEINRFLSTNKGCLNLDKLQDSSLLSWKQQNLNSIYTYYLQYLIGMTWRYFGVCWGPLEWLVIVFYSTSLLMAYFILLQLSESILFSFMMTLFLIEKADYLIGMQSFLRDFSKVPLMLMLINLTFYLIHRLKKNTHIINYKTLLFLIAYSLFIAIGIGFRTDVKLFIPVPLVIIAFHVFNTKMKMGYKFAIYMATLFIYLGSFQIFSIPEKKFRGDFYHTAHVAILGQGPEFYNPKQELDLYDSMMILNDRYLDSQVTAIINDYGSRNSVRILTDEQWRNGKIGVHYLNSKYEKYGRGIIMKMILLFPATLTKRFVYSFPFILNQKIYILIFCLLLFLMSKYKRERDIFFWGMFIYLVAMSNIQLHSRHYFYLEMFPWFFVAISFYEIKQYIQNRKTI